MERPGLYHLNPYVNLIDPRNISYGNPALTPATIHSFTFALSTQLNTSMLTASVFHHASHNTIQQFTSLQSDTVAHTTFANLGQRQVHGISLSCNTPLFGKLYLTANSTLQYVRLLGTFKNRLQHRAGTNLTAMGSLSYRISKRFRTSGAISYTSPQLFLQGTSAPLVAHNLSLNWDVLRNEKGELSLFIENPFQKNRRFISEVQDPLFYQVQESMAVIRQYSLSFSYRFGKVQTSPARTKRKARVEPNDR
ncbi:Outer membrane cobalamin receptor protein [Cesiribacter andamanensis AMV16]|uniref:Outer membrane cobalamin receptor protein n=1 Tax=Cesiribacter andamanensis AMV16 TaxID=1279009 RepID=M7N6G1_9BACT|nr:Outer membrane cobalamin receptor protein [Cesiribacter andamanensis AMV16]